MSLIRTSVLNGIAVTVRVGSSLMLNKVLAVYVGPAGYALIGQFQNVLGIIVSLAGGVVATGVTKATAENFDDLERQHAVWKTAIRFSLIASALAAICLLFLSEHLTSWLLQRGDMRVVFIWLAATLPALAVNNLLLAIVNGKKEVEIYVFANIAGSLIGLMVTGLLAMNFGLLGALIAFAINPALTLIATAAMVARRSWFKVGFLWGSMQGNVVRDLAGFGLMALTSALIVPLTHILIRDHLATHLGLAAAGYWQATWKISEIYLMLVTSTLSVYYLPRLAEIRTATELRTEVGKVYRFALPVVIACASGIFVMRDFIVQTLFTDDFAPMRELFAWQLTGDVIKIGSWVLGYIMIGRAMVKSFVVTEIGFSISFVVLAVVFVSDWGLIGVTIAYAVNYTVYWICMAILAVRTFRRMAPDRG